MYDGNEAKNDNIIVTSEGRCPSTFKITNHFGQFLLIRIRLGPKSYTSMKVECLSYDDSPPSMPQPNNDRNDGKVHTMYMSLKFLNYNLGANCQFTSQTSSELNRAL